MRAKRLVIIVFALTTLSLGLYTLNPSGTASLDFRGRVFGIVPFHIPSTSMEPTINPGDYILVSTYAYKNHPIDTKDVIVFQYPKDPSREYVKRVIGLAEIKRKPNLQPESLNGEFQTITFLYSAIIATIALTVATGERYPKTRS